MCFERANDPVKKLKTDPDPFACKMKLFFLLIISFMKETLVIFQVK